MDPFSPSSAAGYGASVEATAPEGYLDAVGGQPLLPAVQRAWASAQAGGWADPRAIHTPGRRSRHLLETARTSLASSLSALGAGAVAADEVFFARSIEQARGWVRAQAGSIVLGAADPLDLVESAGPDDRVVEIDEFGRIALASWPVKAAGALDVLQVANPEVGTSQPTGPLPGGRASYRDAAQCVGRIALPTEWTALAAGANDWGGPHGIAILALRRSAALPRPLDPWLSEPVDAASAALAALALESLLPDWVVQAARARAAVEAIRAAGAAIADVEVVGDPDHRLPHVMTFSALYASGEALVQAFDHAGFAVASGSACRNADRPSHVLAAMGAYTGGNVRVSLPFGFSDATIDGFIEAMPRVIDTVRGQALRG